MIRTQEATGKTVDEARAKACALLGVQAEDLNVSYEVLEMPQKTGFLGLKLTPAKVRVSVEEPDAPKAPEAPAAAEAPAPAPVEEKVEAPAAPAAEEAAPAEEPKAEDSKVYINWPKAEEKPDEKPEEKPEEKPAEQPEEKQDDACASCDGCACSCSAEEASDSESAESDKAE